MSEKTAKEGKGKKTFKTIIIIIIVVLAICGGAFGGYMLVNKNNSQASGSNMQVVNNNAPTQAASTQTFANGTMQPVISEFTFELGEFLVNLSDEGEKRFVKANIYIGYSNKKLAKELEGRTPMLRDAINSVLRAKKAKDFTPKGTEDIKLEILNRINPMFKEGRCESIYFNEILVQ
ncbi:MAG: flagellar basal body-associated FliL family protein [Clostridium lundense]|nr:flagellar basal body-associated FliL family protein [Clostridium lundense]